jgi:hypothetical protein
MTKALNTTRIAFALQNVCLLVVQLNNLKKGYKRNHETAAEMAALHRQNKCSSSSSAIDTSRGRTLNSSGFRETRGSLG